MPIRERKSLGDSLVEQKLITKEDLKKALEESQKTGEPLRQVLVRLGLVSEEDILTFLEEQLGIPRVDLSSYLIDPKLISLVPESLARRYLLIPLFKTGDTLTVAMADPLNVVALDEISFRTSSTVEPVVAKEADIRGAINQYYGVAGSIDDIIRSIDTKALALAEGEEEVALEKLHNIVVEPPIIKLVNLIIIQAIRDRASDVHLEPQEQDLRVRFRVDGILQESATIHKHLQAEVISRAKIMADLNIATKRIPQDGRFQIKHENAQVDVRVSTFPTIYGENVVLRLLDAASILIGLDQLGFLPEMLNHFKSLIIKPYGIIFVTGPTGSGKTTTLYAALNSINSPEKNIITLEDPVEYHLTGIRQSQVNPKAGLTFATGLRSMLRQDPDIIMVGEVRDLETAEISIHAALTGHLVFSTLHTNDAPGALTRLIDMGVEPFLVSSSIIGVVAQRLVRTICPNCKESYKPSPKIITELGLSSKDVDLVFYRGKGCKACGNTGYKGRLGIFELMILNDRIRELILTRTSTSVIRKAAQEGGMRTLREDGLEKALAGITTLDEVIRVTQIE